MMFSDNDLPHPFRIQEKENLEAFLSPSTSELYPIPKMGGPHGHAFLNWVNNIKNKI